MPRVSVETSLSRRLFVAMVVPGVLLVLSGLLLLWQLTRLTDTARWVDHTDRVIAKTYELQAEFADQETALRGYLLSGGEPAYLDRFHAASPGLSLEALEKLVTDNATELERVRRARQQYDQWFALAQSAMRDVASASKARILHDLAERKVHSDAVRARVAELLRTEHGLRAERSASADANSTLMFLALLIIVLLLAAAIAFVSRRQVAAVGETYADALNRERLNRVALEAESWARAAQLKLSDAVQGDMTLESLSSKALDVLVKQVGAEVAAVYVTEPNGLRLTGSYALPPGTPEHFAPGEGLPGRAVREKQLVRVRDVPADFLRIESGIGARQPVEVVLLPAMTDGVVYAVFEFGFLHATADRAADLLERIGDMLATRVRSVGERKRLRELLEESQTQSEELQAQQEELRVANEELAQQGDVLRGTQAQLEEQKEQLEASNASLLAQRDALEQLQRTLKEKARELERASQYKSEFLANMSHELRTPLNSTLILAKLLADNKLGNLTSEQVQFASSIYSAGNDLLALINDILDLAKIEAGKVELNVAQTTLEKLVEPVGKLFEPVAKQKGLKFEVKLDAPETRLDTDLQKAQQVLKNLLSNAFKFTERGSVQLRAEMQDGFVRFACQDTGIGIPEHQHDVIFEAFRQADGTTNRRFGGTGLGLSISRDLARLLGGELRVDSQVGQGSTFLFTLPRETRVEHAERPALSLPRRLPHQEPPALPSSASEPVALPASLDPSRRVLLIVEDDSRFAEILARIGEELEFQPVVAHNANDGVRAALAHPPAAIVLDINLPDHSGLTVLDRLKREPTLRHVPVHVMSVEDHSQTALAMGAAGYML
ncbi:MAG TPA: ATP-binding protein, partial [Polyangiales bacterium]|nr:ATP-binding protein [Polyangiales bacterium]